MGKPYDVLGVAAKTRLPVHQLSGVTKKKKKKKKSLASLIKHSKRSGAFQHVCYNPAPCNSIAIDIVLASDDESN